eukprot:CAMPEP_0174260196 /NCGR_PEP_ID=MMETSP0439-20130205/9214_1 /TAXON_ID=0 /ORGANISM="Stereomyxa ramosa, Strain Chinc5" /LENGTH=80 /DNA_ID=CAMNT_0015344389 /DNA_START=23 /DNA_END=262 /DNA_ORIENTATION=+
MSFEFDNQGLDDIVSYIQDTIEGKDPYKEQKEKEREEKEQEVALMVNTSPVPEPETRTAMVNECLGEQEEGSTEKEGDSK